MKRTSILVPLAIVAVAALAFLPGIAGASNPHSHQFTVVAHNAEGSITPTNFFETLQQNVQASVDAPVYRNGAKVGAAETVLTVTRAGNDPTVMVECSVELPEGSVVFNGTAHLADIGNGIAIPVVGGTGRYTGAAGTVLMTATDATHVSLAFDVSTK